jgi:hypothetical protein
MKKDIKDIDYGRAQQRHSQWRTYECMRSVLLQTQFLNEHLEKSLAAQDANVKRHCRDRLMQLDGLYERCMELELSNAAKCLIVKLEELIDVEYTNFEKVWPHLDEFLQYLNGLKETIRNSCRKVFLGKNVAVNVDRINQLVQLTKQEVTVIMQRHSEQFERMQLER